MTQMNLSTKQKQTHRHKEQTVVAKRVGELGKEFGISECKPLYIKWINNEFLL